MAIGCSMAAFVIVQVDLESGTRTQLPERFERQEEAAVRVAELTLGGVRRLAYVIQLVPAA